MKPPAKKAARKVPRKTAAAAPQKKRGNLTKREIQPLVMTARKAYDVQASHGLTDGQTFDQWRRAQVTECVGKDGITACHHDDYRPLLAHFQCLAGDESAALANLLKSGQKTDHAAPGDTLEARRRVVHLIAGKLADHEYIATHTIEQILADGRDAWAAQNPGIDYLGPNSEWLKKLRHRKAAISAREKGHVTTGYLIAIVRQKTRRPDLKLGSIWQDGLADRCTLAQLEQIHYTLVNRINTIEGIQQTDTGRNKKQRSGTYRTTKKADQETPRW